MVWSSRNVVAISINGFYYGRSLYPGSVNDCELSLVIYVCSKVKIFRGSHVSTKTFYLELHYQCNFSVE